MGMFSIKVLWAFVLISANVGVQSQTGPAASPQNLAELGLSYPLSTDWVLATTLMRRQAAAQNAASTTSVLLAAVYVPQKRTLSESSPFFSLLVFPHAHPDCRQFLDAMVPQLEKQDKKRIENRERFSAGGTDFYRLDFEQKGVLRRRSFLCTTAREYVLVWNAGARDEKGLEAVVSTLNSLAPTAPKPESSQPTPPSASSATGSSQIPGNTDPTPQRVEVKSGVSMGLLLKKVPPVYPTEARAVYIQGTVLLKAEISKEGDIVNLELIDGPIELVGSSVDAVRRWKYRPYLLNGEPVAVQTQIQVNYQLSY